MNCKHVIWRGSSYLTRVNKISNGNKLETSPSATNSIFAPYLIPNTFFYVNVDMNYKSGMESCILHIFD